MPKAFESFNFYNYDLVISVTSEAAKGIITSPHTKHICYCLTPTRYLWSGYDEYFQPGLKKTLSKPVVSYLKNWDMVASHRPDTIIAISTEVQDRIQKYYNRDSQIIFPPVDTTLSSWSEQKRAIGSIPEYYLLVSRLVPYKKVDLAIQAFNGLGKKLLIVGTGREENYLKRLARPNIKFVDKLTDRRLADYYMGAKALIFPQNEDFGLVAVEAQSYGTPVIAFKAGGALDTVIDTETGIFFEEQTPESLITATKKFEKISFDKNKIIKNAQRFSTEIFQQEFLSLINNL
jgi:glycosyltransferase involved in cell wall biosynthesis